MVSSVGSSPRMDLFAAPLEGMRRGVAQMNQAAANIAKGDITPGNMVGLIQADALVQANVVSARTADEVLGQIINLKA